MLTDFFQLKAMFTRSVKYFVHRMLRNASSYFTTKAHYGVGETLARDERDTYDQQETSNTVEQRQLRLQSSDTDKSNQKRVSET